VLLFEFRAKVYAEEMELLDQRHQDHHREAVRLAMWRAGRARLHPDEKVAVGASTRQAQTPAQAIDDAISRSRKASIDRQGADAAGVDAELRELGRQIAEAQDQLARLTREGVEEKSVPTGKGFEMSSILSMNRGRNLGLRDLQRLHEEHVRLEGQEMPGGRP